MVQQRNRRRRMLRRPPLSDTDEVEVVERLAAWPYSKEDQIAMLTSIPPQAWQPTLGFYSAVPSLSFGHELLADYAVDTQYGRRRFNVWKPPRLGDRVIVVKQVNPGVLVVTCALRPVGDKLEASFLLLSGRLFAKHLFEANPEDQVFYFYQLRYTVMDLALHHGLLESRGHVTTLLLDGFAQELPDYTPLYKMSDGSLTEQNLEARLSYLQGLPSAELEYLAEEASEQFTCFVPSYR